MEVQKSRAASAPHGVADDQGINLCDKRRLDDGGARRLPQQDVENASDRIFRIRSEKHRAILLGNVVLEKAGQSGPVDLAKQPGEGLAMKVVGLVEHRDDARQILHDGTSDGDVTHPASTLAW
jgi:hypothetical protein